MATRTISRSRGWNRLPRIVLRPKRVDPEVRIVGQPYRHLLGADVLVENIVLLPPSTVLYAAAVGSRDEVSRAILKHAEDQVPSYRTRRHGKFRPFVLIDKIESSEEPGKITQRLRLRRITRHYNDFVPEIVVKLVTLDGQPRTSIAVAISPRLATVALVAVTIAVALVLGNVLGLMLVACLLTVAVVSEVVEIGVAHRILKRILVDATAAQGLLRTEPCGGRS